MKFISRDHFDTFLRNLFYLNEGSQVMCYLDIKNKKVYKVFHEYFDYVNIGYTEMELLKFSNIRNQTFMWASDVIKVNDKIVGYTMPYKKAKNLYEIDPLSINLNNLESAIITSLKDFKLLTDNNILIFDLMYNILYSMEHIYIVDTLDYYIDNSITLEDNISNFNREIKLFLIDNYFDAFVEEDNYLKEMYNDSYVNGIDFIREFRKRLSEYIGDNVDILRKAKSLVKRNNDYSYERCISPFSM